jgi:hypothetical protein
MLPGRYKRGARAHPVAADADDAPATLASMHGSLMAAHSSGDPAAYAAAAYALTAFLATAPDRAFEALFQSPFPAFVAAQLRDPPDPARIAANLRLLSGLLLSRNPARARALLEGGALAPLPGCLACADPAIVELALACMAYAAADLAALRAPARPAVAAGALDALAARFGARLEAQCLRLAPFFVDVTQLDENSIGLFNFLLARYSPAYPAEWVFPFLIRWAAGFGDFPWLVLVESQFLTAKVRRFMNPGDGVRAEADRAAINGAARLQYFALKFARVCLRRSPELRERAHELFLPEDLVQVVGDPGNEEMVVSAGLKVMAELCENQLARLLLGRIGVQRTIARILEWGAYSARIACWRFCAAWIRNADLEWSAFLVKREVIEQCIGHVDRDAPKLAVAAVNFLIAVFERVIKEGAFDVTEEIGTGELVAMLGELVDEDASSALGEGALRLIVLIGEAQTISVREIRSGSD